MHNLGLAQVRKQLARTNAHEPAQLQINGDRLLAIRQHVELLRSHAGTLCGKPPLRALRKSCQRRPPRLLTALCPSYALLRALTSSSCFRAPLPLPGAPSDRLPNLCLPQLRLQTCSPVRLHHSSAPPSIAAASAATPPARRHGPFASHLLGSSFSRRAALATILSCECT